MRGKLLTYYLIMQYSCVDSSPLSNYVMHPFWNAVVKVTKHHHWHAINFNYVIFSLSHKLCPKWVAPNLLTLIGWSLILSNFLLLTYYDWDYSATSNEQGLTHSPIPQWVWLYCGISHFVGYTLDGIDGKQARRTESSTPLGKEYNIMRLHIYCCGMDILKSMVSLYLPPSLSVSPSLSLSRQVNYLIMGWIVGVQYSYQCH